MTRFGFYVVVGLTLPFLLPQPANAQLNKLFEQMQKDFGDAVKQLEQGGRQTNQSPSAPQSEQSTNAHENLVAAFRRWCMAAGSIGDISHDIRREVESSGSLAAQIAETAVSHVDAQSAMTERDHAILKRDIEAYLGRADELIRHHQAKANVLYREAREVKSREAMECAGAYGRYLQTIAPDTRRRVEQRVTESKAQAQRNEDARLAKVQKERDRELEKQAEQREIQALYEPYSKRAKTVLEQVLNFSTTGDEDGTESMFWISGFNNSHKCMLLGIQNVPTFLFQGGLKKHEMDLRQFNWTAFRIIPGSHDQIRYTDGKTFFSGIVERIYMDRLQKAWGIAANECPGKKSAF